jgi:GTPase SAR1 family protein
VYYYCKEEIYLMEQDNRISFNELKLVLVGDGAAGKTSLVTSLLAKGFSADTLPPCSAARY